MSTPHFDGSATRWIDELKSGSEAARPLWQRYFHRLVRVAARRRLDRLERSAGEEVGVAASIADSLCRGAHAGRFEHLADRDDLWRLLVAVAGKKFAEMSRRRTERTNPAARRFEPVRRTDAPSTGPAAPNIIEQFLLSEPTPEFLATLEEEYTVLLDHLPDETTRRVAHLRLDGYQPPEVAAHLGLSVRSVQFKLKLIRDHWNRYLDPSGV